MNSVTQTTLPTLKNGNSGIAVSILQRLLMFQSISVPRLSLKVDGIFGRSTEAAVKDFQKSRGLSVDGVVGLKTWQELSALPGDGEEIV
ncbi:MULTISPECIES: peptidoglycan-binding domain-containing protein [Nostocales]|uniref:Peptidoglycan-binding protein n=3 Tax=Nostocales TaxID=1161 RepID=A0A0C1NC92_9CYAN|nr:peptidoglycan-binding domain-containing protein [Tolypothrix bouteillei]KAF3890281.1 peptidoglycan-binding protein [Tolypothrix bouteillei VB521301]